VAEPRQSRERDVRESHEPRESGQRQVKILVAVGGQTVDEETVRLACRLAKERNGKLYGVHVIEVNRSLPLSAPVDHLVERGEEVLEELEQLASEMEVEAETEMVQARDTGPAIVGEAEEWGADVIFMGLPYKRRFGEFFLGKTVPYVLKNASCRVVLFRERLGG
jgi:nucleotide-binding universal stress UspA family protein